MTDEQTSAPGLEALVHEQAPEALCRAAADTRLSEELALALLERRDLPAEALEALARNAAVMKSRKVLRALVAHPRAPRHVSLPRARHLYTFELMQLALSPAVLADVRRMAEELILTRLETITTGERLALARRASLRVTEALLADRDERVMEAALDSPRLNEAAVIAGVQRPGAPEALVKRVCEHRQWSLRRDVQIALLRNPHTPAARAAQFAASLPTLVLRDLAEQAQGSAAVRVEVKMELERRGIADC